MAIMSLTLTLASRNLLHDRLRFIATLVGIVFSVVLVMIQMGLFLGFGHMVSTMIDHASTDLWVVPKGAKCFEDPSLLDLKLRRRVKVVAITDGIRSFTTTPYIFVDLKSARTYTGTPPDRANNLLVRLNDGADRENVLQALRAQVTGAEVLTTDEFRSRSRSFWLFGTGAGAALFAGALLGVIVGTVIVAQTLYSSTKDHLNEFATLRAMGSSNGYIYRVIIYQALLNAVIGFCIATGIGAIVVEITAKSALPIVITPWLIAALAVLTVAMCVASAIGAIVRVVRIDPATVFMR